MAISPDRNFIPVFESCWLDVCMKWTLVRHILEISDEFEELNNPIMKIS